MATVVIQNTSDEQVVDSGKYKVQVHYDLIDGKYNVQIEDVATGSKDVLKVDGIDEAFASEILNQQFILR